MVNLCTHSVYSFGSSICEVLPDKKRETISIPEREKELGNSAFCIADSNSITSFVKAFKAAKETGMKFIPGCEFFLKPKDDIFSTAIESRINFLTKEIGLKRTTEEQKTEYQMEVESLRLIKTVSCHKVTILAKNQNGFHQLFKLFSERIEVSEGVKLITEEQLLACASDLICIFSYESPIDYYVDKDMTEVRRIIREYVAAFDSVYLNVAKEERRKSYMDLSLPKIISNDVRYIRRNDRDKFRTFHIAQKQLDAWDLPDQTYFMSDAEFKEAWSFMGNAEFEVAVENVNKIVDSIESFDLPYGPPLEDISDELYKLCLSGWERKRKGTKYEQESWERFHYEFQVIKDKNFSQYFTKIIEIINTCHELKILVGPARGSGGGSELCYLTDIIQIDPLKYNLLFERFLNPGRRNFPDIDIDISAEIIVDGKPVASRNLLVSKLLESGIFDFAGYIQNEMTCSTKTLFKDLARYYEMNYSESNRISKEFDERLAEKTYTGWLKDAVESIGLEYEDNWSRLESKMHYLYELDGLPCNNSIAASGVIMCKGSPILPMDGEVIAFNGEDLESIGYIKYDLLSITTFSQIQHFDGLDVPWNENNDPHVWKCFQEGDTDFSFQFASDGMKRILVQVKPNTIDCLAEINALFRPGPIESGLVDKYIDLKTTGVAKLSIEEKLIFDILKKEFGEDHCGLLVFQEDVMRLCQSGAGFTLSEADDVRKAMGKKKTDVLAPYRKKFIEGWKFQGDPDAIWTMLENYSHYAFNKSHSVAYAVIAYATIRQWAYYRDELLEYCLNHGTKERFALAINKCQDLGFKKIFPDYSTCEGSEYKIKDGYLYLPGNGSQSYRSPVEMLFDPELDYKLIYEGCCDVISKDREAMATLASTCLKNAKNVARYMEPEDEVYKDIYKILDGLIAAGGCVKYERKYDGIHVFMKRYRGNPSQFIIHGDNSPEVRNMVYIYDTKYFGCSRSGTISKLPEIQTDRIINILQNTKERAICIGRNPYYAMRDRLAEWMRERFVSDYQKTFEGIYAILEDTTHYSNSTRVRLRFDGLSDVFYVMKDIESKVRTIPQGSLVKMTMVFSPFIRKRDDTFIYDFDITAIEIVR